MHIKIYKFSLTNATVNKTFELIIIKKINFL
jgi:hypothetical protein